MPEAEEKNFFYRYSGYFFVFLAATLWALLGPFSRIAMQYGLSSLEIAFWRAFFGGLFFVVHGLAGGHYKIPPRVAGVFSLFGIIGVAVLFAVYTFAVQYSGAAMASVLLYTAPAWVAIFSRIFFKEGLSLFKLVSIGMAFTGIVLICLGGLQGSLSFVGIACGLLSGLFYSFHYIFGTIYLKNYSTISLYMFCMPVGAALLFPLVDFAPKNLEVWLVLAGMGLFSTYCAYSAYCEGLKRISPTRVAVLANLEPMLAALFAYMLFGEMFTASGWAGSILILGAVFIVVFEGSRRKKQL